MALGKNIKGITIEFDGDTTKLGRAISKIDNETKSLDSQLKQVDRALKFNPGNTELLAQKQQLLAQKVGQTKDRLEKLKAAQAKLDDDPAVDKTSQDYMELRREIIETESKLTHFEQQLKAVDNVKLEQLGKQFENVGGKMKGVGDNMTRYVTGPLAALGGVAAKVGLGFDSEMSKVAAISGATGDEFATLREKAREMGRQTAFSAEEAGQGFEYMAMAGWKTGDMLTGIEPILNLATASGTELGTTSDIVTDAMTAFGLSAEDSAHFADVLAAASTNANTNVEMMGETFQYAAPVAGALGYSVDDVAVAIGLMANNGIKASSAGTSLRTLLTNMAKPTDAMAAAMDTLGVSLDDGNGNMKSFKEVMDDLREGFSGLKIPQDEFTESMAMLDDSLESGALTEEQYGKALDDLMGQAYGAEGALKAEAAATLAGKTGMSGLLAIVNSSEADYEKLTGAIQNCDGATQQMADTMLDNAGGSITIMKSALSDAAISISDVLAPYITIVANKVSELAQKFAQLSPTTQKVIITIAGIAAAIGPLLVVVGTLLSSIGKIIIAAPKIASAFGMISKAFTALKATLLANPWVLVAAAAIAAIVLIYKNWDKIKAFFAKLWEAIKAGAKKFKEGFVNVFKSIGETIKTIVSTWFKIITWPYRKAWELIKKIAAKIKDVFNFKFKLPHIKLPHFKVQPPGWKLSDLLHGEIPSLGIDWYAKGGIFRSPSVIGVGEKGPEAVLPIDRLNGMLVGMADSIVNGILSGMALQGAGQGGEITIPIYLYPSGPKMGEETVRMYDQYKRILG